VDCVTNVVFNDVDFIDKDVLVLPSIGPVGRSAEVVLIVCKEVEILVVCPSVDIVGNIVEVALNVRVPTDIVVTLVEEWVCDTADDGKTKI